MGASLSLRRHSRESGNPWCGPLMDAVDGHRRRFLNKINYPFLSVAAQRHLCSSVLRSVVGVKERRLSGEFSASVWSSADAVESNTDEHGYPRMNTDGVESVTSARGYRRRFLNKINHPFLSVAAQRHPCSSVLRSIVGVKERRQPWRTRLAG